MVATTSQVMQLPGIEGRVLFPTLRQGPWLPLSRLAETTAHGPSVPDMHSHMSEEVLNYVIEGGVRDVDSAHRHVEAGAGSVIVHASGEEFEHDVVLPSDQRSRWFSVVLELPKSPPRPAGPSQVFRPVPPSEVKPGILTTDLVGGRATARSALGAEVRLVEFQRDGELSLPLGPNRRSVAYVTAGHGSIAGHAVELGTGVLTEGMADLPAHGRAGLRAVLVTVPPPQY